MKTVDTDSPLVNRWKTLTGKKTIGGQELQPGATIARIRQPAEEFKRKEELGTLPRIAPHEQDSEFRVRGTIGQGGMGLIRLAEQTSLYREVAIKTLHREKHGENTKALLQESWITGMLEHPNIVPVHALGVDESGGPMLVMKKIEGISWEEALDNPEKIPVLLRSRQGLLETHIQILLQVTNALQFAHSKGVIHCDLKPDNIMLGEFGEVYLLDWGIAVALDDDGTGRLPLAKDITEVSGTPTYISPELASGQGHQVGPWTDVYLLGGLLHRIVTGRPRHDYRGVFEALLAAYQSDPFEYDATVPNELARICNQATHVKPEQRYQNVGRFRAALNDFLQHQESRRLCESAIARSHSHSLLVNKALSISRRDLDDDTRGAINTAYTEARFGFAEALSIWSENSVAKQARESLLKEMFRFLIHLRDEIGAGLLFEELKNPTDEEIKALDKLRAILAVEAEEIRRNEEISRSVDLGLASRARSIMSFFLGLIFGGVPIINHILVAQGIATLDFQDYFTQFAIILPGSALVVYLMRDRLLANKINARIITCIFVILFGCLLMRLIGFVLGLTPAGCIALENSLLAFSMAMMTVTVDKRLWPAAVAFLIGAFGGAFFPPQILLFDGFSNAAALFLIALAWREKK